MKVFKPDYLKQLPYVYGRIHDGSTRTMYGVVQVRLARRWLLSYDLSRMTSIARWIGEYENSRP